MSFAEGRDTIQDITNSIQVDSEKRQIWIICWLHDFQEKKKTQNIKRQDLPQEIGDIT